MNEREFFDDHLDRLKSDAECVAIMGAWIEPHEFRDGWESFIVNAKVAPFLHKKGWAYVMRGMGAALMLNSYQLETAIDRIQAESQGGTDE